MKHIKPKLPRDSEVDIVSDNHDGARAFRRNKYLRWISDMKANPHRRWIHAGDAHECITPDDKRFSLDSVDGLYARADLQLKDNIAMHEPIKDQCLTVLMGNHEDKLRNVIPLSEWFAEAMGVPYGTYLAKLDLSPYLRILVWHGMGNMNSKAGDSHQREMNEEIWVKRKMRHMASDCELMVMGHIHKLRIHPPSRMLEMSSDFTAPDLSTALRGHYTQPARIKVPGRKGLYRIPEEERWYCSTGAWLGTYEEGYSTYGEKAGYSPQDHGVIRLTIKGGKLVNVEKVVY